MVSTGQQGFVGEPVIRAAQAGVIVGHDVDAALLAHIIGSLERSGYCPGCGSTSVRPH
jgi:hypothetical protein